MCVYTYRYICIYIYIYTHKIPASGGGEGGQHPGLRRPVALPPAHGGATNNNNQ